MIKAVMFDLDNTLIDFMSVKKASVDAAIDAMIGAGVKVKRGKARKIFRELYEQHGMEHNRIFQKFLKVAHKKVDYKVLAEGIVAYRKTQVEILKPYKDVKLTLSKLKKKGLKLAIVSDAPRINAWLRLVEMGLHNYFDVVVCFEDTGEFKHTGLPFRKALRMLKLKSENCVMVGDWPARDIIGAKKLGIKTIFARYGAVKEIKKSGADFDVNSVKDVVKVVGKLS
jgi:putative hydrolase of the HAD superfamily